MSPRNNATASKPETETVQRRFTRPSQEHRRIGISRRGLTALMKNGAIPFMKIGRTVLFDPSRVDAALAKFEKQEVTR